MGKLSIGKSSSSPDLDKVAKPSKRILVVLAQNAGKSLEPSEIAEKTRMSRNRVDKFLAGDWEILSYYLEESKAPDPKTQIPVRRYKFVADSDNITDIKTQLDL